ncbi:MAG: 3-deoxy-7-phosphoheptulonate synthase [Salibacteraceae bacterium]
MIVHLKSSVDELSARKLAEQFEAVCFFENQRYVLVTSSSVRALPEKLAPFASEWFELSSDIQLASRTYRAQTRKITIGRVEIGGDTGNTIVIGGPCSVESETQIRNSAELMVKLQISALRGGCFKPRTSPYSFQGLGVEGLKLLAKMRAEYGLTIVSEVRDASHVDAVIEHVDVIQIGAKSMYDHGILRACAKTTKPVLLKRGFGSTLQEFVQAAEFILSGGNPNVMLCERGIRTFETKTRFTLDLCGVAWIKEHINLPVILDPSHALGYRYGIADLSKACLAMGVDGLLIEVHPDPNNAKSDAAQQLNHEQFERLMGELKQLAPAVNRTIV